MTSGRTGRASPPGDRRAVAGGVALAVIGGEIVVAAAVFAWLLRWEPFLPPWTYRPQPAPFVRRQDVGRPISDSVVGLTMFRGNSTRTYYGEGPVPSNPRVLWRFPTGRPMCAISREIGRAHV